MMFEAAVKRIVMCLFLIFTNLLISSASAFGSDTCELYVQKDMDGWINWGIDRLFGLELLSDEISGELKSKLTESGFTLIPKKITFDPLGLVAIRSGNQFAVNRQGDRLDFYFNYQDYGSDHSKKLKLSFQQNEPPSCERLQDQVRRLKLTRFFLLEAMKNIDDSWGLTLMAVENAERAHQGRIQNFDHWPRHKRQYISLKRRIEAKVEVQTMYESRHRLT